MFEQTKLDIAVIDHDKSPVSEALTDYLASQHNLIDIPDTKTAIQDNLFYRHVYYVLTIPKDFTQSCKSKTASLTVTKVPGSTSGYYVDSQVNAWAVSYTHLDVYKRQLIVCPVDLHRKILQMLQRPVTLRIKQNIKIRFLLRQ